MCVTPQADAIFNLRPAGVITVGPHCIGLKSCCPNPLPKNQLLFLVRGDHPNFEKNAPRMKGELKIFQVGSHQFRESLRELLRELWLSYCSSRGMPFREWNFVFREWNFEFRELLREPRNSPRAPRMAFSLRERFS